MFILLFWVAIVVVSFLMVNSECWMPGPKLDQNPKKYP